MPQVTVKINGRSYTLACDDGEEEHLEGLAAYLDKHVTTLAQGVGQVGDQRLMLMAGFWWRTNCPRRWARCRP
ncbi:cell division protein ZapA [Pyruvatibacter mobilis]|uniref:cell division protein ZapA n=1 Tax=Pyruvatibacter mobilis TaxID=1712261 RepID=UPI003BA90707